MCKQSYSLSVICAVYKQPLLTALVFVTYSISLNKAESSLILCSICLTPLLVVVDTISTDYTHFEKHKLGSVAAI